ncbi:hypothetical protein EZS27_016699 [termite gut metagenome]|uniref:Uncharacterized protein n=1 Tax=termite gut metagenome TaxID=433724 RepID=A0A5J4RLN5_9ZZZZ
MGKVLYERKKITITDTTLKIKEMKMEVDFIKDKDLLSSSMSELISSCGSTQEIAQVIDDVIFSYITVVICGENTCAGEYESNIIYIMRSLRDLFNEMGKNTKM